MGDQNTTRKVNHVCHYISPNDTVTSCRCREDRPTLVSVHDLFCNVIMSNVATNGEGNGDLEWNGHGPN